MNSLVTIVNFIRGVEPRLPMDLVEPVRRQLELGNRLDLPSTFLLQYDALTAGPYTELLKTQAKTGRDEIGCWLELNRPHCERAGIPWRGRYDWDWHAHIGFTVGYSPAERERLVDVYFADFKAVFGYFPRSAGSWFIDAHTLAYLADRYNIAASCNCKDQANTDGYTLWGGYWNQAYYPSRGHMLVPAQSAAARIPVPVFRMLGSDPIYQYDAALSKTNGQGVVTLEPVYCGGDGGGGIPAWVDWFFKTLTEEPRLGFSYTQVGQENSFGWPRMEKGLTHQYEQLARLRDAGLCRVLTLGDAGEWFKAEYPSTPPTTFEALTDWRGNGRWAAWYNSERQRVSVAGENGDWRIRDWRLFDDACRERYLNATCPDRFAVFETPPLFDGFMWSGEGVMAGLRPVAIGPSGETEPLPCLATPTLSRREPDQMKMSGTVKRGGEIELTVLEDRLILQWPGAPHGWAAGLRAVWSPTAKTPIRNVEPSRISLEHDGFAYKIAIQNGQVAAETNGFTIRGDGAKPLILLPG